MIQDVMQKVALMQSTPNATARIDTSKKPSSSGKRARRRLNSTSADSDNEPTTSAPDETASQLDGDVDITEHDDFFSIPIEDSPTQSSGDQTNSPLNVEDLNKDTPETANNSAQKKGNPWIPASEITGRRLFEPIFFITALLSLKTHTSYCGLENIEFDAEQRLGFHSNFRFRCKMCNRNDLYVSTEEKKDSKLTVNTAIVSGALTSGGSHATINDIAMSLNMPSMSKNCFYDHQERVNDAWDEVSRHLMQYAVKEEIRHAKEIGNVTADGTPRITVVCDGAWARRSYRTNYTSLSGVAAIVGYYTRKVLYFGVKNKYCIICHRAASSKTKPRQHTCYKNWSMQQSSTAMEAQIVTEGFCSSLNDYGVIYDKMIADGDSNVYKKIREANPYKKYNIVVEKIECRNHLLRNFDSKMRAIASTGARIHGTGIHRKKIGDNRMRMRTAVSCAIKHRKSENDLSSCEKINSLKSDILNMPYHILGQHQNCPAYFCTGAKEGEKNLVSDMKTTIVWDEMYQHVRRLALHARSLIYDVENNVVERFNSGLAKLNGGKRVNYTLRGSFNTRCAGAVINHNDGRLHYWTHKNLCDTSPGFHTKKLEAAKLNQNRRKDTANSRVRRPLGVTKSFAFSDPNYGEGAQRPDMSEEDFAAACDLHMATLKKSPQEIADIERRTVLQRDSHEWVQLHSNLLTASSFFRIAQRRPHTSCANIVKNILYSRFDNDAMEYGRVNEDDVRYYLGNFIGKNIVECGLFIHPEHNFLAASPDGLIDDDTIVEIKCSYSAAELKMTPIEAIRVGKVGLCKINKEGEIYINKKDKWYIQIQGQLNITGRKKCIFALYTPVEPHFYIAEIYKDSEYWENDLLPKLIEFYINSMRPELVDPRKSRNMEIREPDHVIAAQKKYAELSKARAARITARKIAKAPCQRRRSTKTSLPTMSSPKRPFRNKTPTKKLQRRGSLRKQLNVSLSDDGQSSSSSDAHEEARRSLRLRCDKIQSTGADMSFSDTESVQMNSDSDWEEL
ncbi:hypothetical protein B566_EDAN014264 [Ephemera danica]|nr:hypothetical protein B566_EDAN014264 [Ephemera danica]